MKKTLPILFLFAVLFLPNCKKNEKNISDQQLLNTADFIGTWTLYSFTAKLNSVDSITFLSDTIACMPENTLIIRQDGTFETNYIGTGECLLGIDKFAANDYLNYEVYNTGTWKTNGQTFILSHSPEDLTVNSYVTLKTINNKIQLTIRDTANVYVPIRMTVYLKQ